LELRAVSYEQLGLKDRALSDYESLYLKQNNIYTLYKMAVLQGDLGRFNESLTNLDIVANDPKAAENNLAFQDENQQQQAIPMSAAAYNIKGLIHQSQGNTEEAKTNFEKALEIAPEFHTAKQNLQELE
jgi:tetratricopeptide (TPR) repeat protein